MACRALSKKKVICTYRLNQQITPASPLVPFLAPSIFSRNASTTSKTKKPDAPTKKKKERKEFKRNPVDDSQKFALCDAIRYLRAFEVGQLPTSPKFELAVSLRSLKNGPVVRNRMRLPHAVSTAQRIAVICKPDSQAAAAARGAGAVLVAEDALIDAIKEGRIEFNQLLCHQDSAQKLNKAGLGRILGPKGLMPSSRQGTIVRNVAATIKAMVGGTEYKEKIGVIRLAIGQLGFTPEQVQANIRAFMANVKKDLDIISDKASKDIHEVVSA
ncbi:MAG: hypothetical protein LQ340_002011 [Diploschistes diacapsis]|nr:MAG: hypothetical protein LQ340_002011 [Diploschistes diacapsis]